MSSAVVVTYLRHVIGANICDWPCAAYQIAQSTVVGIIFHWYLEFKVILE